MIGGEIRETGSSRRWLFLIGGIVALAAFAIITWDFGHHWTPYRPGVPDYSSKEFSSWWTIGLLTVWAVRLGYSLTPNASVKKDSFLYSAIQCVGTLALCVVSYATWISRPLANPALPWAWAGVGVAYAVLTVLHIVRAYRAWQKTIDPAANS